MTEPIKPAPCDTPTHDCDQQQAEGSDLCVNCGRRCDAHRKPIAPATDAEIASMMVANGSVSRITRLIARIEADAAKLRERDEQIARLAEMLSKAPCHEWCRGESHYHYCPRRIVCLPTCEVCGRAGA